VLQCNTKGLIIIPHISLRVTEDERITMESYAKVQGLNISEAIKDVFFQRLEDEFDLQRIREYRAKKTRGEVKTYTHAEVMNELGFD
jgi:hypothetical protein